MHIEFLVEDLSGKKALEVLVPKIIGKHVTFRVHSYKGIGPIPRNMKDSANPSKRILLTNLPKLLKGYGRTYGGPSKNYSAAVVLVCDLDDKDLNSFLAELNTILHACHPKPTTRFCIAIEEGEAWFLGDLPAVRLAYPQAEQGILNSYVNDTICGTWEKLADAIHHGGSRTLVRRGWQVVGAEKEKWAREISPHMKVDINNSPSFCFFRDSLRLL